MATNEIFRHGDFVSLPVPDGTKSGDPVRVGGLNAVAQTDKAVVHTPDEIQGYPYDGGNPIGNASCALDGAWEFQVDFAVENVGDPVYIVTASNDLVDTDNSGANPLYGHALTTKSATTGPLTVRLAN